MTHFIGVTGLVLNGRLQILTASDGSGIDRTSGISPLDALNFLWSLKPQWEKGSVTLVSYALSREFEYLFSDLPADEKDILFASLKIRRLREELENENEALSDKLYTLTDEELLTETKFNLAVNEEALDASKSVKIGQYEIVLRNGKSLTIRRDGTKQVVTLYDLWGFFNKPFRKAYQVWCKADIPALDRSQLNKMGISYNADRGTITGQLLIEADGIARLASTLDSALRDNGIALRSFHGIGAVSSAMLSKAKATDEYHAWRYRRQYPNELWKAVNQSYFGGRVEKVKLGTMENVRVYDLNSAYANAVAMLPRLLKRPQFVTEFSLQPFSLWYVELGHVPRSSRYLMPLPHRTTNGRITYAENARGYFWFPEVNYILQHPEKYPNARVKCGFVWEYEQADFGYRIKEFYETRVRLRREGNPLADILKLALAGTYGKFGQRRGQSKYYNLFYAGWITSYVRARLLEAVQGHEDKVIAFLTDAIHTVGELPVEVSERLGDWSCKQYDKGIYLDTGVYALYHGNEVSKIASMGASSFDVQGSIESFYERKRFNNNVNVFVGHSLHTAYPMRFNKYLRVQDIDIECLPFTGYRRFNDEALKSARFVDSFPKPSAVLPRENALYVPSELHDITLGKQLAVVSR